MVSVGTWPTTWRWSIGPLFLLGMAWFNDWHAASYVPATVALLVALFAFVTMRDTPQSVGLPPIEQYKINMQDHQRRGSQNHL